MTRVHSDLSHQLGRAPMNQSLEDFKAQFAFDPSKTRMIGVEQECFIADLRGNIVPHAQKVLARLASCEFASQFSFELSACQIERKTRPCYSENLKGELQVLQRTLDETLSSLDLQAIYDPVAPEDMPLDVFPDQSGRYQKIAARMDMERLRSSCRVIATNIHIGMPDHESALCTYNTLVGNFASLLRFGDKSGGKRLAIYQSIVPDWKPRTFTDWGALHRFAVEGGFAHDVRSWWSLIRISRHGTIEARWLDATESNDEATAWAREFLAWCIGSS